MYAVCRYAVCRYAVCRYAVCRYAVCRYAVCRYAVCRYAVCRYAVCRYAVCRYAVCRYAKLRFLLLWPFDISGSRTTPELPDMYVLRKPPMRRKPPILQLVTLRRSSEDCAVCSVQSSSEAYAVCKPTQSQAHQRFAQCANLHNPKLIRGLRRVQTYTFEDSARTACSLMWILGYTRSVGGECDSVLGLNLFT